MSNPLSEFLQEEMDKAYAEMQDIETREEVIIAIREMLAKVKDNEREEVERPYSLWYGKHSNQWFAQLDDPQGHNYIGLPAVRESHYESGATEQEAINKMEKYLKTNDAKVYSN